MSKAVQIHVGDTMEDVGVAAIDAWHRMERGEDVDERHVSFATWETMVRVLSPKRLELLRHIHREPAKNIRVLAQALGRNYRRVHEGVSSIAPWRPSDVRFLRSDALVWTALWVQGVHRAF